MPGIFTKIHANAVTIMNEGDAPKKTSKARQCNAEAFIEEFAKHTKEMDNKRYCFLLGAGASKSSGISLGGELAIAWLKELHAQEAPNGQTLEQWANETNLQIPGFKLNRVADFYTKIFERRFDGRIDDGQFWIEQKFGAALPSTGYYFLAQILGNYRHKVVITTNFDNLAADAILQLTGNLPRIIGDAKIARFLSPQPRLPIIAKVHGDIGFATTVNTTAGIATLDKEWKEPLRRILESYVPIVIGWEGNDGSLMDFFTEVMVDDRKQSLLPSGIFWCYRGEKSWQDRLSQNPKLSALTSVHHVRFIKIDGFDEWMRRLALSLTDENPLEKLQAQQKLRLSVFESKLREELRDKQIEASQSTNPTARLKQDINSLSAILHVHSAMQERNPEKRLEKLRNLAKAYPNSSNAQSLLASAFQESKAPKEEIEQHYKRALELEPDSSTTLGSYAHFLHFISDDPEQAEAFYIKAVNTPPQSGINLSNYALFLEQIKCDYKNAEHFYQMALNIDTPYANALNNYASFLQTHKKDSTGADHYYQKALTTDPNMAHVVGNYALFLQNGKNDHLRAEEFYRRALAIDPNDQNVLLNFALFCSKCKNDDTQAEELTQRAIAAGPQNSRALSYYAVFLAERKKDYAKSVIFHKKAIALDPHDVSALTNYAEFVLLRGDKVEARAQLATAAVNTTLQKVRNIQKMIPILWIAALIAEYSGEENDVQLGSIKTILNSPEIRSEFDFEQLVAWIKTNDNSQDNEVFWATLASVCCDKASVLALDRFSRWQTLKLLPPTSGLSAIAARK